MLFLSFHYSLTRPQIMILEMIPTW